MSVKIKIEGDGLFFEKEISVNKAGQIIAFLGTNEQSDSQTKPSYSSEAVNPIMQLGYSKKTLRDYIMESGAKTYPEKIIIIAKYICETQNLKSFRSDEIKPLFSKARLQMPQNYKRDFDNTIKFGWVSEDFEEDGTYYITQTGDEIIESNFKILKKGNIKSTKKAVKNSNKIKAEKIDVLGDDKNPSLKDFLDNIKLKSSNSERIVAIAYYFKKIKNIDIFTTNNIEYVYRTVGLNKKPSDLRQALTDCKNKKQWIDKADKKTDQWKIDDIGIDFVENNLLQGDVV